MFYERNTFLLVKRQAHLEWVIIILAPIKCLFGWVKKAIKVFKSRTLSPELMKQRWEKTSSCKKCTSA